MNDAARGRLPPTSLVVGFALCLALGVSMQFSNVGAWLDAKLLDVQMRALKQHFPTREARPVVVVGIDEADVRRLPEPMTLWHPHLGAFLQAVAEGHAAAVGVDVALPERSFDAIVPGNDQSLMLGILSARKSMPMSLALTLDAQGKVREVERKFRLLAGNEGMGMAVFPHDIDGVVRRFDERLGDKGAQVPTLVGQLVRGLGRKAEPGYLDYSRGSDFTYLPLRTVLDWSRANDTARLRQYFEGRPVLLGSVLPAIDRAPQPMNLAAWEDKSAMAPGVILHAQALRLLLNGRLVQPVPTWVLLLSIVVGSSWWFAGFRPMLATCVFLASLLLVLAAGAYLFRQGWHLAPSGILASSFFGLAGRATADAAGKLRERRLLRRAFSASVSPSVMQEIMAGTLVPRLGGERQYLCILFSDIRGFTTRSEAMSPEAGISLLNRYFDRVVKLVHAEGGAVVNFMGDGIMAIFGAPKPLANPCAAGFAVAKAMQAEVARFNEVLAGEGLAPIEIGVGLHAGEAVVGNVGAAIRNDYTAIGDVPNVASRVEGLTKTVGFSVACTEDVAKALDDVDDLVPLGPQAIKGHTPVNVYGWGKL